MHATSTYISSLGLWCIQDSCRDMRSLGLGTRDKQFLVVWLYFGFVFTLGSCVVGNLAKVYDVTLL
jgi:hypothetical protein